MTSTRELLRALVGDPGSNVAVLCAYGRGGGLGLSGWGEQIDGITYLLRSVASGR